MITDKISKLKTKAVRQTVAQMPPVNKKNEKINYHRTLIAI